LKAEKKGSGKKGEEKKKSDELSVAEVKGKVDPNAKTLDEYQKERKEKKRQLSYPHFLQMFKLQLKRRKQRRRKKKRKEFFQISLLWIQTKRKIFQKKKNKKSTEAPNLSDSSLFPQLK